MEGMEMWVFCIMRLIHHSTTSKTNNDVFFFTALNIRMPKEKKYDHICFGLKPTLDAAACDGGYLNSPSGSHTSRCGNNNIHSILNLGSRW